MARVILAILLATSLTGCLSRRIVAYELGDAIDELILEASESAALANFDEATIEVSAKTGTKVNASAPISFALVGADVTVEEATKMSIKIGNLKAARAAIANDRRDPSSDKLKSPKPLFFSPGDGQLYDEQAPAWRQWLW